MMVEDYLLAKRNQLQRQLNVAWINSSGKDISDLIRGKIQAIDDMLELKNVFDIFEKAEKDLEEQSQKFNKGAN